jgi:hypothetical protein
VHKLAEVHQLVHAIRPSTVVLIAKLTAARQLLATEEVAEGVGWL